MKKGFALLLAALMLLSLTPMTIAENTEIETLRINPYGGVETAADTVSWLFLYETYYLFLPADTDLSAAKVYFDASGAVTLDGETLSSGGSAALFTPGAHTLCCGEREYPLQALYGSSVPTVYIATDSGTLDNVHADKEYKEPGTIRITNGDGTDAYNGKLDYIKGRGNATWGKPKKPYNIKLNKKAGLFGMAKSKKWCLIACYIDNTLLRNDMASELANEAGISRTPRGQHVQLYVNGEYLGLYYLMEKVEIDSARIDIYDLEKATEDVNETAPESCALAGAQGTLVRSTIKYAEIPNDPEEITGGYLLEFEAFSRYANEPSGFVTAQCQPIVVKSPEYASRAQVEYISAYYQEFEDAIYSPTGYNAQGKHYSEYIDLNSLAREYILQEYTENYDGCNQSFFLYKDVDGVLTFGPAWDFDHALGLGGVDNYNTEGMDTSVPEQLFIKSWRMSGVNLGVRSLLGQAYMHNDFQSLVSQLWTEDYEPYLDTWLTNGVLLAETIAADVTLNAVRWNTYGTTDPVAIRACYLSDVGRMTGFMTARRAFLTNAFSPETYYVKYDNGTMGSTIVNDDAMYHTGDAAVVKSAPNGQEGYAFAGWNTSPDGSGTTYLPGETIAIANSSPVLHAMWKAETKLTFWQRIVAFFQKIIAFIRSFF